MKPNPPNHDLPDFDRDLEEDAVWSLLSEATSPDSSPRFIDDTLRRVRLDEAEKKPSFWQSLLSPKPLLFGSAGAIVAAFAIMVSLSSNPDRLADSVADTPHPAPATEDSDDWNNLEDSVAYELLSGAAEDPTLLSDAEIVTLLY